MRFPLPFIVGEALPIVTGKFSHSSRPGHNLWDAASEGVSGSSLSKGFLPGIWQSVPINHSLKRPWAGGWETRASVLPLPL